MASTSIASIDLSPEPDLHPIYPSPSYLAPTLAPNAGLAPPQKAELVTHCLTRACLFGDLPLLSFLLTDHQARTSVDLGYRDEDGLGLISLTIQGFGLESDRDVEREECVRLLISEGADVNAPDNAGWTALHHAALFAPPTLVSHLMTHGCSPFAVTERQLTPLDIVTAHSTIPGRQDVALLLGEAMRSEGWTGSRMEDRRKLMEKRMIRQGKRQSIRDEVGQALGISPKWWGDNDWETGSSGSSDDEDDIEDERLYTPLPDYTTMLVFSPPSLPEIFQSLITNVRPSIRNSEPANALYMLARFACLTCDDNWLEDLVIGATDVIEETFFSRSEDLTSLVFWLYNTTAWLHLMRCDNSINENCELLGSFVLIEEVINSVFVFIIRYVERRIDTLIDTAILEHAPFSAEFDGIQFESEWSFLRSLTSKKKTTPTASGAPSRNGGLASPGLPSPTRPPSPGVPSQGSSSPALSRNFASLRQSFSRTKGPNTATPIQSFFQDTGHIPRVSSPSPIDITSFFDALQTFLTLSGINPALITQMWSQVMYWVACEIFNRVMTRRKYLCRSRAVQIGMNLSALEEWVESVNLPRGVISHLAPVKDLLAWLQCLSSINEFSVLVATIQTMKNLNPLQMRRAVRDYKYEVNEGRMTEECSQYLAQLQKDWERHRVKLGVEALRREMGERDREREDASSIMNDTSSYKTSSSTSTEVYSAQRNIDLLFDRDQDATPWEPAKPPEVLGEFLDSRHMLPLLLPSDPRMLSASPKRPPIWHDDKHNSGSMSAGFRSASRSSRRSSGSIPWQSATKRLREVGLETLQWVDGIGSAARWTRPVEPEGPEDEDDEPVTYVPDDSGEREGLVIETNVRRVTPLTQKPPLRNKGRVGSDMTPVGP